MAVIEVDHLHKAYGDVVAVEDVSFTIEAGEIFGILGPNGAGKTTTVETIAGLREADRGHIRVLGLDPARRPAELHALVGVQLQDAALPDKLRVGEALDLYASFYPDPADPDELLATLGLTGRRDSMFRRLSGGERQRLSIALALVGRPRIAILDELTSGLDPRSRRETWSLVEEIRDRGVTVVLVTHFMEEAERLADRVAVIDRGRVVALDTPAGLAAGVRGEHRLRFRPSAPIPEEVLTALPSVTRVDRAHDGIVVHGRDEDVLGQVVVALAGRGVTAQRLRVDQVGLEDAFVALTGARQDSEEKER